MTNGMGRDPSENEQYPDSAFIDAVDENGPVGTTEVAEHIGCVRETARLRLTQLEQEGVIDHTMIAGAGVWYIDQ